MIPFVLLLVASLSGPWRAVLDSPGGELPFTIRFEAGPRAVVVNGEEEIAIDAVEIEGRSVRLRFDVYDSEVRATLSEDGARMTGEWTRTGLGARTKMAFSAVRGDERRFDERASAAPSAATVAGAWSVVFTDESGTTPARAEFALAGSRLRGTFLTPTGDYRFLDGTFSGGRLRLSTFDGAHAFLFDARLREDGALAGDFWSRDTYHATWTARRGEQDERPDPFSMTGLANPGGRLRFAFPDLDGKTVTHDDPRFEGLVLLVVVFGTWCPNCNDEAPLLARLRKAYGPRGLEIVGLAFEMTGEKDRDREFVRRFAARHGLEHPQLLAGTADKAAASRALPDLTRVLAFPTTVFLGRDGRVRKIHTGFDGPATGEHYERLVAEFEREIERLLAEGTAR